MPARECAVCYSSENLKACGRCKTTFYCSTEHAKMLWPLHKRFCATGVEAWYEDDLTEEELVDLASPEQISEFQTSIDDLLSHLGRSAHFTRETIWSATNSTRWTGDLHTRSYIISYARHLIHSSSVHPLKHDPKPPATPRYLLLALLVKIHTFKPSCRVTPADLALRTRFLAEALAFIFIQKPGEFEEALEAGIKLPVNERATRRQWLMPGLARLSAIAGEGQGELGQTVKECYANLHTEVVWVWEGL